jgi:hypothetical protein
MGADEADIPKGAEKTAPPGAKRRARPPVTIDLQAESVPAEAAGEPERMAEPPPVQAEPETPTEPKAPPTDPAGPARRRQSIPDHGPNYGLLAAAGVAGGLVVLALGFGLQAAGIIPTPGHDIAVAARSTGSDLSTRFAGLDQRLQGIEAASSQTIADRALLDDIARRVGVADAFGNSLGDRILTLEATVAALDEKTATAGDPVTQQSIDALSARIASLEATPSIGGEPAPAPVMAAPTTSDTALEQRVAALEGKVAALATQPVAAATAPAPVAAPADDFNRADALAALRGAAGAGGNFGSELAVVGAFGMGAAQVTALAPLAEKNVPDGETLALGFPEVANDILAAANAAEGGVFGQILAYGRSLVRIRPSDAVPGDDPAAIVSRVEAALKQGDLAAAHAEWEKLPAAEQDVSRPWAEQVADRVAIDRLVEELALALGAAAGSG